MSNILFSIIAFVGLFIYAIIFRSLHLFSSQRPTTWIFFGRRLYDWPWSNIIAIRSGFDWFAFAAPPIWAFAHESGLLGMGYFVVLAAALPLVISGGFPLSVTIAAVLIVHFISGCLASAIRSWSLIKSGHFIISARPWCNSKEAEEICHRIEEEWKGTELPVDLASLIRETERLHQH